MRIYLYDINKTSLLDSIKLIIKITIKKNKLIIKYFLY
jgi:hypothetical protein